MVTSQGLGPQVHLLSHQLGLIIRMQVKRKKTHKNKATTGPSPGHTVTSACVWLFAFYVSG